MGRRERIAIFGGDGRRPSRLDIEAEIEVFPSPRDGGNGGSKRLFASLRSGTYDRVIILTRWNSHTATKKVRKICKRLGIPVQVCP